MSRCRQTRYVYACVTMRLCGKWRVCHMGFIQKNFNFCLAMLSETALSNTLPFLLSNKYVYKNMRLMTTGLSCFQSIPHLSNAVQWDAVMARTPEGCICTRCIMLNSPFVDISHTPGSCWFSLTASEESWESASQEAKQLLAIRPLQSVHNTTAHLILHLPIFAKATLLQPALSGGGCHFIQISYTGTASCVGTVLLLPVSR